MQYNFRKSLQKRDIVMIRSLVKSVFTTGCLSVASEGLIRQVLEMKVCKASDLEALDVLNQAVNSGQIQREADDNSLMLLRHNER